MRCQTEIFVFLFHRLCIENSMLAELLEVTVVNGKLGVFPGIIR